LVFAPLFHCSVTILKTEKSSDRSSPFSNYN
jgi:hypothetical protein